MEGNWGPRASLADLAPGPGDFLTDAPLGQSREKQVTIDSDHERKNLDLVTLGGCPPFSPPLPYPLIGMLCIDRSFQVALVGKNLPANAGDLRDTGSIPRWGRSPGEGNGNPLQYPCLENPMDRGAWQATVHRVATDQTQLKQLSTHIHR